MRLNHLSRTSRQASRAAVQVLLCMTICIAGCAGGNGSVRGPGPQGVFLRGKQAYERGRHMEAIELLEAFERQHPGSQYIDDAIFYLGKAHQANREQLLARQSFERLIEAFPRSSYTEDAFFEIGRSWFLEMRSPALDPEPAEEAMRAFRVYERRYPDGKYRREAEDAIRKVLENLAKKDYLNARTYMRLGRPEAARRYFHKSLDRWLEAPIAAKAAQGIAQSYERERRWPEAREAYSWLLDHLGDTPKRYEDGAKIARMARTSLDRLPQ
ncbi:MAG: outer membrane protein assembly factor BamD [Candidatus Eisenbacteria sp.]|nr:outer membrane protein assembly factor BamD [Candidatus Eisenbacteria bacterium]